MQRKLYRALALAAGLGCWCLAGSAQAQITFYTDEAAFLAATSGLTTINFNGLADDADFSIYNSGDTIGGVAFTNSEGSFFVTDPLYDPYYDMGTDDVLTGGGEAGQELTAWLPGGVSAVGTYVELLKGFAGAGEVVVTVGADSFVVSLDGTAPWKFIGVTSGSGDIASLSFSASYTLGRGTTWHNLDNFRFGSFSPTAVPEPSEWAALGLGALGIGGLMVRARRRR